ncbi:MAG: hypothetical protein Q8Q09_03910 [Deltaproteobacteria bacterium]|nr:hypothetical protein [Deltaproteobacteria bacterium]
MTASLPKALTRTQAKAEGKRKTQAPPFAALPPRGVMPSKIAKDTRPERVLPQRNPR